MNLKEHMIDYVGKQHDPNNDEVTVEMVIETLSKEFPEFLLMMAEENYLRGYEQALDDMATIKEKHGQQATIRRKDNKKKKRKR